MQIAKLAIDFQSLTFLFSILDYVFAIFALSLITRISVFFIKRIWLKDKRKLVYTPIDSIERRSNISYDDFVKEYTSNGTKIRRNF